MNCVGRWYRRSGRCIDATTTDNCLLLMDADTDQLATRSISSYRRWLEVTAYYAQLLVLPSSLHHMGNYLYYRGSERVNQREQLLLCMLRTHAGGEEN